MEQVMHDQAMTLLYVEDEADARERVSRTLAMRYPALEILTADNGQTGIQVFREKRPAIVVTDISMPVMDGIQMARELKSLNPEVIIAAMTAYNDTTYLLNSIEIGISYYIMKPIDYGKLFTVIDRCIDQVALRLLVKEQNEHIRKLSRAVEQSPSSVIITDIAGNIEYVNPRFSEVSGYPAEEAIGKNPRLLKTGATPPEVYEQLWQTITSGSTWHGEFLNRKKNDDSFWELASISPLYNEEGIITHFVAVKEDITERKKAEEEIEILNTNLVAQAAELREANRELEAFSYSVSHDLCKPLTIINGYCQVILEICGDSLNEQCRSYLREIYEGTMRMNQLIDALLNFSRLKHSELHREKINLSEMTAMVAADLKLAEPERQVTFVIAEGVAVDGDAKLLHVVLENLLGNAWKYTGKRGEAVIEFGTLEVTGEPAFFVRDNGAGFDMADAEKIFTPFQRLAGATDYKGYGIGLASVQRIVQRHGGRVWAEGERDRGASFYFTLPTSASVPGD